MSAELGPGGGQLVASALEILRMCRHWLTDGTASALCGAAINQNDSIYQAVAFSSPDRLADTVRWASGLDYVTDIEAIVAFAWSSATLAIQALHTTTMADEIDALELYRTYLESIAECVTSAGVWLSADECEACNKLGDLAADASRLAYFKAQGYRGELIRRQESGQDQRDQAIRKKALELIRSGTRLHDLSGKLRAWQLRETGVALSKPAMNAILKKINLHS